MRKLETKEQRQSMILVDHTTLKGKEKRRGRC